MDRAVAARVGRVRLREDERRACHRLDAAGDEQVAVAGDHGVARADDRRETGRAQPVHRDARDGIRQPGEKRRQARNVAIVLPGLVRATEPDVLDLLGCDARALDRGSNGERREVVWPHPREPAAVAPDGRPNRGEDDGAGHVSSPSSITRCAIAKAPLAAGTPQYTAQWSSTSPISSGVSPFAGRRGRASRARARAPSPRARSA